MDKTIDDVRSDLDLLVIQKEEINKQLILMNDNINRKDQELRNMLAARFVGKFVKRNLKGLISYGVVHSIADINTAKVMNVGFTVNNKIDRSCELISISDLDFASESEVADYIFGFINDKYKKWRAADE